MIYVYEFFFFFASRRRHTSLQGDWSSDVCSSDLARRGLRLALRGARHRYGDQVVTMLGPAGRSVPHHDFDPARLHQVIEVAPRRDAAEAGEIRNLHCCQVAAALLQDAGDEVERRPRQALWKCLAASVPEDGVEGIDRVLVRL